MKLEAVQHQRILYSALNWGMGHVARSIGLIRQLSTQKNEIILACDSFQQTIFSEYFPELTFVELPPYPFNFKGKGKFEQDLLSNCFSLYRHQSEEYKKTQELVKKYQIDVVISDHRYGFRSHEVPSIFVTHQLQLPIKWIEKPVQLWHTSLLKKFDKIWVMDFEDLKLGGELSKNKAKLNCQYIGAFSRFEKTAISKDSKGTILIASGPDIYAQQLIDESVETFTINKVIARPSLTVPKNIQRISTHWKEMDEHILSCHHIISRSGYTTILDNYFLDKKLTMIPTKGQSEQEYLAKYHSMD